MLQAILLASIAALVGLDQWTKWLAIENLKGQSPIAVIADWLQLNYVENRGAAWGIMQGQNWLLIGVTGLVSLAILGILLSGKYRRYRMANVAGALIVAGGIGNLIDRIFRTYVVDFIQVQFVNFPVFNVADCFVTCGAVLLLIYCIFFYQADNSDRKKALKEGARRANDTEDNGREDIDAGTGADR